MPAFIVKWSAESIRERGFLQAMKHGDPLLLAWQTTLSRKAGGAAILDTAGRVEKFARRYGSTKAARAEKKS